VPLTPADLPAGSTWRLGVETGLELASSLMPALRPLHVVLGSERGWFLNAAAGTSSFRCSPLEEVFGGLGSGFRVLVEGERLPFQMMRTFFAVRHLT
jgi:hypothetical protein